MTALLEQLPPATAGVVAPHRRRRELQPDRPAYLWCFLAAIVLSVLSGNSKLLHLPIGPDRVAFAAGLLLLLLDPVATRVLKLRLTLAHVALVLLIAAIVLSASLDGTLRTSLGIYALLDRVVVPFGYLLAAPLVFGTRERRDLLMQFLVWLGLYLGATAFFEVIGPHSLVFPTFIMDPAIGINFGQARGPFTEPEADGLVLCACSFVAVLAFTRWTGRWRYFAALVIVLDTFGVFLTLTRSVWLGTTAGALAAGVASPSIRRLLPRLFGLGAIALLVVLVADPGLRSQAGTRAGTSRSVYDRRNTDDAALRIVREYPLTGVGWANFVNQSPNYVRQAPNYPVTTVNIEVHNVVLSRAAELGLPAALVFVIALLAGPLWAAVRKVGGDLGEWRLVTMAYGSCWLVVSMLSPLPYPLPNSLLWLFTGMVLSPVLSRPPRLDGSGRPGQPGERESEVPARRPVRWSVLAPPTPRRPGGPGPAVVPRRPRTQRRRTAPRVPRRPAA